MLDVSVMCGRKRWGDAKWSAVFFMSVVNMAFRGCEEGGRSQSDDPGIFDAVSAEVSNASSELGRDVSMMVKLQPKVASAIPRPRVFEAWNPWPRIPDVSLSSPLALSHESAS